MSAFKKVTPLAGEPFSFLVRSDRDPSISYRVEIDSYQFVGQCSCPDYTCRKEKAISKREAQVACKHIRMARSFYIHQKAHERAQKAYDDVYRLVEDAAKEEICH